MILNSFELSLTEQKIKQIQATIIEVEKDTSVAPFISKLELDSLNVFLNELVEERDEFLEISQKFKHKIPVKKEILKYPENLVYIRIANDISQEDKAKHRFNELCNKYANKIWTDPENRINTVFYNKKRRIECH